MGKYAAITAYMEISCRKMDELTKNLKGQDKKKYLKEESAKYDIQLNDLPEELQPNVKAKSYMMLPWATFDSFFTQFAKEVRLLVNPDFKINAKEDENKLEAAIRELNGIGCYPNLEKYKLDTYYYYNKIRTNFAHNLWDEKSLAKEKSLYNKLDIPAIKVFFPSIKAPSAPSELNHQDFILFEAMIIHIADMLTVSIESKINWEQYIVRNIENNKAIRRLKDIKDKGWKDIRADFPKLGQHNGDRRVSYVNNCIKCIYGVRISPEIIEKAICSSNKG